MSVEPALLAKVRRFLRGLGPESGGMVVAISGGPDSVALLRALLSLRDNSAQPLVLAHLNHTLRGDESDADETFVRQLFESLRTTGVLNLELRCERIDMAAQAAAARGNLESTARQLRYRWLEQVATAAGVHRVATGHNADDQAETVLHRLLRGTGLQGLRGIAARRLLASGIEIVRPLLTVTRAEVLAFLDAEQHAFRLDSSNRDRRFTRNRIRHELLPTLREYNPAVARTLAQLAEQAEETYRTVEDLAGKLLADVELPRAGPLLIFDRRRLAAAPRHLMREMFRLAWAREGWPLGGMGYAEWERLADVAGAAVPAVDFPGGIRARCQGRVVRLGPMR